MFQASKIEENSDVFKKGSKNLKNLEKPKNTSLENNNQISIDLSKDEIAIILQSIKNSNFNGSVLESLYNLVYKLQNNYNKLK